jgi:hypothetical protein
MLDLESEAYDSKNPLNPVNQLCRLLQMFLRSHIGFIREDLQGYLNMFFIIIYPPANKYAKIERILNKDETMGERERRDYHWIDGFSP